MAESAAIASLLAFSVFMLVLGLSPRTRGGGDRKLQRLTEPPRGEHNQRHRGDRWRHSREQCLHLLLGGVATRLNGVSRSGSLEAIEKRLEAAGEPLGLRPAEFLAIRVCSSVGLAIAVAVHMLGMFATLRLFPLAAALTLGYRLPDVWLGHLIARRQSGVLRDFPAALDLMVVCTDAGLNLHQALAAVTRELHGPLGDEFSRMIRETSAGKSAMDALRSMSRRVGLQPVSAFVNSVVTAETLGTPVSQVLRLQAAAARANKRHRAEEAIGKLPMKLTLITVFLLMPGLFVIAVLPSVLSFLKTRW